MPTRARSRNTTRDDSAAVIPTGSPCPTYETGTAPLRILLALESAGAGAGRHVLDLAGGLLQRGHVVHLAWSPLRAEPAFSAAVARLEGLASHVMPMSRAPRLQDAAAALALRRLFRKHRFDIVHGHSSKAGALVRIARLGSGVRAVYTPHAFVTFDPQLGVAARLFYGLVERLLAKCCHRVICVSNEEREHALGLGIAGSRLVVVPNGLAPLPVADRSGARRILGLRDGDVCVGFVGRLSAQKGVGRLVEAFARIRPTATAARLVIIGDGPERCRLATQAVEFGVTDCVTFVGEGDGPALMAGFDLFVLPSRYEAFPYVLLEAAARGLPIVATDVGGVRGVVRAGQNGYILRQWKSEPELLTSMAAALAELIEDPERREAMGRQSALIVAGLGADAMIDRTVLVYREALAGADQ